MNRHFLVFIMLAVFYGRAFADPGDTTVIQTFISEFQNWADPHVQTFDFDVPEGVTFSEAWLHIELGCPGAPGDCDPWDRTARLSLRRPRGNETEEIELARYITPYDITGSGRPGSCGWDWDMLDYLSLLRDSVTLVSFIESYIGGNQGWLVTATFYFVEGESGLEAYRIENLWNIGYLGMGNPDDPPENHLPVSVIATDSNTSFVTIRITTTGHGQGNTQNAAEFSRLDHGIWVNDQYFEHLLWRDDCNRNPCSPQGGTWQFARANWCPGSKVFSWDNFPAFSAGGELQIEAVIQDYENFCRPDNPDCIPGQTCADCNFNGNGHTGPNYNTTAQIIFWRATNLDVELPPRSVAQNFELAQNFPNPFNPNTTIRFSVPSDSWTRLRVFDVTGREVSRLIDTRMSTGEHEIEFEGSRMSAGIYFYSLEIGGRVLTRKMVLLK